MTLDKVAVLTRYDQMVIARCTICRKKDRLRFINEALDSGRSNRSIAAEHSESGFAIGPAAVASHRKHYRSTLPSAVVAASTKRDLAIMVRDKTIEAIEDGRLEIDGDNWNNINPGLSAQKIIEQRESRSDAKKVLAGFARLLLGGSGGLAPVELIEDGLTIEGEATEIE